MSKLYTVTEKPATLNIFNKQQEVVFLKPSELTKPNHKLSSREHINPLIKREVFKRDNRTCQCCKRGGERYIDLLDVHSIIPESLGGQNTVESTITLCVKCHRLVHLYSTGDLATNNNIEPQTLKRIEMLGTAIKKSAV